MLFTLTLTTMDFVAAVVLAAALRKAGMGGIKASIVHSARRFVEHMMVYLRVD